MDKLQTILDTLGLEEYINTILVEKGGRPAFMIQPSDYKESRADEPITSKKIQFIKKYFPDLHISNTNWGVIISKQKLDSASIKNGKDIGKILGYPCYKDFDYLEDKTRKIMSYEIFAKLKYIPELSNYYTRASIFINQCIDKSTYNQHKELREKFEKILKDDKIVGDLIINVEIDETELIPPSLILSKLKENKRLNKNEYDELINIMYNLGFSMEFQFVLRDLNIYDPYNRGIICGLVSNYINNPLEPFFPLQNYPKQDEMVIKKINEWETSLIGLFSYKKKQRLNTIKQKK